MSTVVKICGITTVEDAVAAAEAGADLLGFILWPGSKRAADADTVAEISARLGRREGLKLVGVFVNQPVEQMVELLDRCGLDLAQLSGDEPPALVGDPSSPLYGRTFKALRPTSLAEAEAEAEWYVPPEPVADQPALLVDAYHPTLYGGTGQRADWEIAARLAATVGNLMLAGGLSPANVGEAVRQVRPYGVDVASGVERAPGRKDHELVRAFIAEVRQAAF